MGQMLIRGIPDDIHDALRERARAEGTSAEALVRAAIADRFAPDEGERVSAYAQMRRAWLNACAEHGLDPEDAFDDAEGLFSRDKTPIEPFEFED